MSRSALLLFAGLSVFGLSSAALADPPLDYPPPYSAGHFGFFGHHHYAYLRHHHYATSPYHRHSGIEPYSYYYPEK